MQSDVTMHNERVKKNRVALCHFSDAVCHLANQELQFRGHDDLSTSLNMASFMDFFLLCSHDRAS
jgi:hypothetical protein